MFLHIYVALLLLLVVGSFRCHCACNLDHNAFKLAQNGVQLAQNGVKLAFKWSHSGYKMSKVLQSWCQDGLKLASSGLPKLLGTYSGAQDGFGRPDLAHKWLQNT